MSAATNSDATADGASTLVQPKPSAGRGIALVVLVLLVLLLAAYAAMLWNTQRELRAIVEGAHAKQTELAAEARANAAAARTAKDRVTVLDAELERARAELDEAQQQLSALEQQAADADAQMQELEAMAARFQDMIDSGKLQVTLRRGRMVVDLPAQVLFPSGSAELSEEGQKSLRQVARILRTVRGKRFIVGGHTDTKKLTKQAPYSSNWALSAARAVMVTEAMVRAGLPPARLVAAGYGPHDPVASNRNEKGRQQNRRIEIILEPQVHALPEEPD